MNAMRHIRKTVLNLSQAELARLASTTQASVCRWENGDSEPNLSQMQAIRSEVLRRGMTWNDSWFFEPPTQAVAEAAE